MRPRRNNLPLRGSLATFGCEALEVRRMLSVSVDLPVIVFPPSPSAYLHDSGFNVADDQQSGNGTVTFSPDQLRMTFNREADTIDGAAGAHSIQNSNNWQLTRDGVDVSSLISTIEFSASHVATLHLKGSLGPGHYTLVARDVIYDATSHTALDGDNNQVAGGNAVESFTVSEVVADTPETWFDTRSGGLSRIETDGAGNYVLFWYLGTNNKPLSGLVAQHYDSHGVAVGNRIAIPEVQGIYAVAMNAAGDFVISWGEFLATEQRSVVYAQRFRPDGTAATGILRIAQGTSNAEPNFGPRYVGPGDVGIDAAGNFVVVWTDTDTISSQADIEVARFTASGILLGSGRIGSGESYGTHVAMNSAGQFAVSWLGTFTHSDPDNPSSALFRPVYVQMFRPHGGSLGQPKSLDAGFNSGVDVAIGVDGSVVVVWQNSGDSSEHIKAQRFNASGNALGSPIEVDQDDNNPQQNWGTSPSLATISVDSEGRFIVSWTLWQDFLKFVPFANLASSISTGLFIPHERLVARVFDANRSALSGIFGVTDSGTALGTAAVIFTSPGEIAAVWTATSGSFVHPLYSLDSIGYRLLRLRQELELDLNGNALGTGTMRNLPSGGQSVSLVDSGLAIHCFGISQLSSASVTIENALAGDSLEANTADTNLVANFANGVLTISGNDTPAAYQAVLRTVTFSSTAARAAGTNVHIKFSVTGGSLTSDPAEAILSVYQPGLSSIRGRYIFYNNSAFDGHDAGINAGDDGAIAVDKAALTPMHSATFANYTSYSRGINGIIIDLDGEHGNISANDFQFKIGNSSDPKSWKYAPAPLAVSVRAGAGVNGSDRIEIVWADYSILNTWLEVSVAANGNTGLAQSDSFYFGNAVGETGNMTSDARVNALDYVQTLNYLLTHPSASVGIDNRFDFNRDGAINAQDFLVDLQQVLIPRQLLELVGPGAPSVPPGWAAIVTTITNHWYLPIPTTGDGILPSGITSGFAPYPLPNQTLGAPDASDVPALLDAYWSQHTGDDEDDDGLELINV